MLLLTDSLIAWRDDEEYTEGSLVPEINPFVWFYHTEPKVPKLQILKN